MKSMRGLIVGAVVLCAGLALPLMAPTQQGDVDTSDVRAEDTPVGNLIRVPIERTRITDFIYQASGLGNAYLVNTSEDSVIIDTGFAHQAQRQMELLKEVATGPMKYIFLPHPEFAARQLPELWTRLGLLKTGKPVAYIDSVVTITAEVLWTSLLLSYDLNLFGRDHTTAVETHLVGLDPADGSFFIVFTLHK